MSFKDVIASDVHDTFMNADEFSDMHDLNGKMMPVQVDSNEQIEREKRFNQHMDGIYKNQKLIYVAATDYGPMPKQGSLIQFDKRPYKVADAISEDGIYSITLEAKAKTTTLGKVAKGKKMESEVELEILYIKVEINNAVVLELDKLNFVFVLNGKDMLAQIRSQC